MKKIKTARELALEVLTKIDKEKSYSNLQLNQSLQKIKLSRTDINFATEMIYGTIQHLNTIDWIIQMYLKTKISKLDVWVRNLLRLSIYQIWYLDRIPPHAAVNEAVNIAKKWGHKGISGMVNGVLRNILRNKEEIRIPDDLPTAKRIALEYSHPEWLVELYIDNFGIEETIDICRVNNLAPYHSIRVNTLKTTKDEMIKILKNELGEGVEINPSLLSEQGIRIKGGGNLAHTKWYKEGLFSVQDESSMLVAEVLAPKPNMVVLDATAAPGGKTTHIAEKMQNKGRIIASDLHKHKIKLINEHQERLGIDIIETIQSDARELNNHYRQIFDRILLDVPCSGLGVIRRKPDLKWVKAEKDIKDLVQVQEEILEEVAPLLKSGGVLVYSTCTLVREENQEMVKKFIEKHPEFQFDHSLPSFLPDIVNEKIDASSGMIQILPQHFNTDGFFISRLIKKM
ncbi:16S rRNA (cytosine(967)-C(5))-methyltransferase [Vulcanibacillus modesticaldus]|uniref:16S rRNA (cytosine(967)-C(5))-methyltransferase n=1 Tax=Vulcanibacillus modesticaldus TaxID=337097 RepID=A0A1D2YTQ3_9BACI|nr:16S rRNA (cytosine(967)-C(5))-methyltransferase RsmB [Vulcanibacillus modesticaldus]OEF99083.1 16S rRNA (cytosine(967)-C(5))-methyltransferase [Vulcanibacillus modesticaldus]